jgi:hypothetical protein
MIASAQLALPLPFSWLARAPAIRAEHWLALFIVAAGMALPDCCLTGHHLFGAGMETFGPICHANL